MYVLYILCPWRYCPEVRGWRDVSYVVYVDGSVYVIGGVMYFELGVTSWMYITYDMMYFELGVTSWMYFI